MLTLNLTYPGSSGTLIDTIDFGQYIAFRSYAIKYAILSCCPRRLEVGPNSYADSDNNRIGSASTHYRASDVSEYFAGTTLIKNKFNIYQADNWCSGEPFQLKICIILSDFYNQYINVSCVRDQSCPGNASYVDVT